MYNLDAKTVIHAFVNHLDQKLKVARWPDEENSQSPDIDAIAGSFAIEHTSIDTLPQQRQYSARFMKVINGLEKEFRNKLLYRLNIVFPYEAVRPGQDWDKMRYLMKQWIDNSSQAITDGVQSICVPGIPFELKIRKASNRTPGLFFSRFEPPDNSLHIRIASQLERKAKKLLPYKEIGYITIILVESNDFALMNLGKMLTGIRNAFARSLPQGVDQIWYAETDTDLPEKIYFDELTKAIQE